MLGLEHSLPRWLIDDTADISNGRVFVFHTQTPLFVGELLPEDEAELRGIEFQRTLRTGRNSHHGGWRNHCSTLRNCAAPLWRPFSATTKCAGDETMKRSPNLKWLRVLELPRALRWVACSGRVGDAAVLPGKCESSHCSITVANHRRMSIRSAN